MATISKNFNLVNHNYLRLPAVCAAFCCAVTPEDIHQALEYANRNSLKVLVLGDGSNVVLGDLPDTIIIDVALRGIEVLENNSTSVVLKVMAGENWHQLVETCVNQGYSGIENLALIPGRVGAAPVQNIGAYGVEIGEYIELVEGIELEKNGEPALTKTLNVEQCRFAYRDSIFKQALRDKFIITAVHLKLSKQFVPRLDYQALRDTLSKTVKTVTAQQVMHAIILIRTQKLPDPAQIPNVGSFFKNPVVSQRTFVKLIEQYPNIAHTKVAGADSKVINEQCKTQYKIAAAWLIEQCGFKGVEHKGLAMHQTQALVLTRLPDSPCAINADAVKRFARQVQASVEQRFGIAMEIEPRCYP